MKRFRIGTLTVALAAIALIMSGCGGGEAERTTAPASTAKKASPTSKPASRPAADDDDEEEEEEEEEIEAAPAKEMAPGDAVAPADAAAKSKEIEDAADAAEGEEKRAAADKAKYDGVAYELRMVDALGDAEVALIEDASDKRLANYPLKTCVVTGQPLGDDAISFEFKGVAVRVANREALDEFMRDPVKHLNEVNGARKKQAGEAAK